MPGPRTVSTKTMDKTIPIGLPADETFDIGSATGTPVDDEHYQLPFTFTGKIEKLTITVEPPKLTPQDLERLREGQAAAQDDR